MEQDKLFIENYFTSPIYWTDKPEWVKKLNKVSDKFIKEAKDAQLVSINERNKKFGDKKDHSAVYHSSSLINVKEFSFLKKWILTTADNLLNEQGYDLTNYNLCLTELWVQEFAKNGGGHHSLHTHWNGHISGFYFLKASDITSCPVFEDPRAGRMMNLLPEKNKNKISYASSQIHFKVKPGKLIIFNSFLPHMYIVDDGYEPFRFIHWNIQAIPKVIL